MSGQLKRHSMAESVINVVVGYGVSTAAVFYVFPLFNVHVSGKQNMEIAAIFTVISLIRSYILRRVFNWYDVRCRAKLFKVPDMNGFVIANGAPIEKSYAEGLFEAFLPPRSTPGEHPTIEQRMFYGTSSPAGEEQRLKDYLAQATGAKK